MPLKKCFFEFPEVKKLRVIIDTDCNCEADDLFAVAHGLMTPRFDVMAITAEHYGTTDEGEGPEQTMLASFAQASKVVELMGLKGEVNLLEGCRATLPADGSYVESPASRFIVEEALRDDPRPLYVLCQGAVTNLASAYLMDNRIADRLTAIWIGGAPYPEGGWEFNLTNDLRAANVLMDSGIAVWQVPSNVYGMMRVSIATLMQKVYPCGEIGKYMMENLFAVNRRMCAIEFVTGEVWQLGDSPVVGLLLHPMPDCYTMQGAPRFDEEGHYILRPDNPNRIRLYHSIDARFILDDMYAKLLYYFG